MDSYSKQYLRLLGASSAKEVEEHVVSVVRNALSRQHVSGLQVRLSKVAREFNIRPKPDLKRGTHDGEIAFEVPPGEFVIKLCTNGPTINQPGVADARLRFTYAHEFAHRFCFIQSEDRWERALNVVTSKLHVAERMRHRITLRNMEEGLCNRIARRLLIPDEFVNANRPTMDWFAEGDKLFDKLSAAARRLGVSRDCLLVRLQDVAPERAAHCAFIVGFSRGPITHRGAFKLRIISGLFPSRLGSRSRQFYPGVEWANFGKSASDSVMKRLQAGQPLSSEITIRLHDGKRDSSFILRGWYRIISAESMIIWGQLT